MWERLNGKNFEKELVPFGEYVFYKTCMDTKMYAQLQPRWEVGVYVGNSDMNDSYLVYDPMLKKVIVCPQLGRRRKEQGRYRRDYFLQMQATP